MRHSVLVRFSYGLPSLVVVLGILIAAPNAFSQG